MASPPEEDEGGKDTTLSCNATHSAKKTSVLQMMSDHSRNYPVFWGHGRLDQVVAYKLGEMSVQLMKDDLKIKNVTFKRLDKSTAVPLSGRLTRPLLSYNMYHESDPEELDDLKEWLKVVLPEE